MIAVFKKWLSSLLLLMGLILFLVLTDPQQLPLVLLFVPFILLFFAIYFSIGVFLETFAKNKSKRPRQLIAVVGAGVPVMLLILQSIDQSSATDTLIAVVLLVVFVFYFVRADFLKMSE